jgi:hypothetical protein
MTGETMKRKRKEHTSRKSSREFIEYICTQPGCRFRGKRQQQGVCFSRVPDAHEKHIIQVVRDASKGLDWIKQYHRDKPRKDYVRYLESMYVTCQANWTFCLEEVILLRKENAILKICHRPKSRRR